MTRHYELPLLRSLVESVNALINNNNGATGNPEFTVPSRTLVQGNPVQAIATNRDSVWNERFDETIRKRIRRLPRVSLGEEPILI
jgi:hypothetical protein